MQVNTAGRDAAISPGSSDSLADFAGTYATHLLPAEQKEQVTQGCEITIKVNAQGGSPPIYIFHSSRSPAHARGDFCQGKRLE